MPNLIPSLRHSRSSHIHDPQQIQPIARSKSVKEICEIAYLIILCILSLLVVTGAITIMFSDVGMPICLISLALLILMSIFNPCLVRWIFTREPKELPKEDEARSQPKKSATKKAIPESSQDHQDTKTLKNILRKQLEKGVGYVANKFKGNEEPESKISQQQLKHRQIRRASEIESSDSSPKSPPKARLAPLSPKISSTAKTKIPKKKKTKRFSHGIQGNKEAQSRKKRPTVTQKKESKLIENQNSESESSPSSSPPPMQRKCILPWFYKSSSHPSEVVDNSNEEKKEK
ncbi:hypothetical protein [Candidatus Chlamydia corallus]|uniref:hypothetical protein n=1 Tax=Candidatus Chlamydia corallus TaxID=2038470 RepID=UPI000C2FEC4F|nr:hypothetical protein [Candidatus Chlamydia corallus]